MKFEEGLKSFGWGLAGIAFIAVIFLLGGLYLVGAVWVSERIFPWLVWAFWITVAVALFILGPLTAFGKTRVFAAIGLLICSYVFGVTLWVFSLLLTLYLWGWIGVVLGLAIAGVGIVPIAFLAALFKGQWTVLDTLFVMVVATFGVRFLAFYIADKAERATIIENY